MITNPTEPEERGREPAVPVLGSHGPFGPMFFLHHLTAFVRERCPQPSERLPVVLLHLMDGAVLDICHVIGLAPDWVALAVHDDEREAESRTMRTELLPYETIHRITVRSVRPMGAHVGFVQEKVPSMLAGPSDARVRSPRETLQAAAVTPPLVRTSRTRVRLRQGTLRGREKGAAGADQP